MYKNSVAKTPLISRFKNYRNSDSTDEAEVNMTPMLDIVFIMLIFFIVSSTFIRESGLDLSEPPSKEDNEEQQSSATAIVVQLCQNRDVFIDSRPIDVRSVRANIERKIAESVNAVVLLESALEAPTDYLVKIIDQVHAAKAPLKVSSSVARCSGQTG